MTTIAESLGTTFFQLSPVGFGALAVGIEDFRQRINNVLNTIPGTDPFRPFFGCNAYKYLDQPLTVSVPNVKKEIYESLSIWIPEVTLTSITHYFVGDSQTVYEIAYSVNDSDLLDVIEFNNGNISGIPSVSGAVIITAAIPVQITNGIYRVSFILNDQAAYPAIPEAGFASPSEMLKWLTQNWFAYGRWYLTAGSLVLYLNSGIANKVSLTVTEKSAITLRAYIPDSGYYNLVLNVDGTAAVPPFPVATINTVGGLLSWVNSNWGFYGVWSIETISPTFLDGDFSNDFSDDFNNASTTAIHYLVFQTENASAANLTFI